jgi:L-aminopeptidase/D-esterase-like protein
MRAPHPSEPVRLPGGVLAGHATDRERWTGCTVLLAPPGSVAAVEVRGGGPGTRESDVLGPAAGAPGVDAVLLTGGSAFGLSAADGVVRWLRERGRGFPTPAGPVPLVFAAVVFDLGLGAAAAPGADDAHAACDAADPEVERGSVGAGTGCTAGKLLGTGGWTKSGLGAASVEVDGARLVAIAVANPLGDILAADGSVAAGAWRDGRYERSVDLLRGGARPAPGDDRQHTTLVALVTDAALDKREAWLVARSAAAGVARAVEPSATPLDGDTAVCLATGRVRADPLALAALAATATSAAIRDAAARATGAPGCPAAGERA